MLTTDAIAPHFTLPDLDGGTFEFTGGSVLLVFFETDCPTCRLLLPYLNRLADHLRATNVKIVAISQDDQDATQRAVGQFPVRFPVALDRELNVSRKYDPAAVPALFWLDELGKIARTQLGFSKNELNSLSAEICAATGVEPAHIADAYDGRPNFKPGCLSRHLESSTPSAAAERTDLYPGSAQRASRIELMREADALAFCVEAGYADPLPVVPPTLQSVEQMLQQTAREPDDVIGLIPPNYGAATVEKIAANAVMAGCPPEIMPVLLAVIRAASDERFNIHGVQATTHFAAPLVVVNGPASGELGFACGQNVFSNVARANSTLGRALQLVLRNLGGARPDAIDMSTLGNSAKFSCCIAENEEHSPWEPLHVEHGFDAQQSAVTLFAGEPPRGISEHKTASARQVLRAIARCLATTWSYRVCMAPPALVVLGPEHAKTIAADGWSKQDARHFLFENTGVPIRAYTGEEEGEGTAYAQYFEEVTVNGERCYRKFKSPDAIRIVVAGGTAGKFSAVVGGWGSGPHGSQPVTYPVDD